MEKSIEKVLQAAINTSDGNHRSSVEKIRQKLGIPRHEVVDAVNYLSTQGLAINQADGYLVIVTPTGLQYFNQKKSARRTWIAEHWLAPFMTGFLSGVLVTLAGTALVTWLLHR